MTIGSAFSLEGCDLGLDQELRVVFLIYRALMGYAIPACFCSQVLLPSSRNSGPKNRTADLHVDLIERTHNRLYPVLVNLRKELLDCFFGLRAGRVRSYRCASAGRGRCSRLGGRMKEHEFDIFI
jgi:hypothetical protein